jgi:hypothetical protein
LLIAYPIYGQTTKIKAAEDAIITKTKLAENTIRKYIAYSYFKNGISEKTLDSLDYVLEPSAKIVFDIPLLNTSKKNNDFKRMSKDDRQLPDIINVFGKSVSRNLYKEILKRESQKFPGFNLDSSIITLTGRKDSLGPNYDTMVIEVEKIFNNTDWCVESRVKYLYYLKKTGYDMNIFKVIINDENTSETDIVLKLVDGSLQSRDDTYYLQGIVTKLRVEFDLSINNYPKQDTTDLNGIVRLIKTANRNSRIFLDSVTALNGVQYEIPSNWKGSGKRLSDQPVDGFTIALRPYKWNGFAYSLSVSGGGFIPGSMDLSNFQSGTSFDRKMGYKLGLNLSFTYFFNKMKWKTSSNKWLIGVGSGISVDYQSSSKSNSVFSQNTYNFIDIKGDTCQVLFKGKSFSEKDDLLSVTLPVFVEFKRKLGNKSSFSIQTGINLSFPLSANYNASGSFSRWGYYDDLNSKPVTNDYIYNYFSDSTLNFSGNIEYNTFLSEGFVKLKGYFNIFKNNPDNSLEIGLVFSMPFPASNNYTYPGSRVQNYSGYWLETENNSYHSVAYSVEKIYKYYFGISIGINLINYKLQ